MLENLFVHTVVPTTKVLSATDIASLTASS